MMPEDVRDSFALVGRALHDSFVPSAGVHRSLLTIRTRLVDLEAENERLRDMLRQVHKDYGCEIRDPCGTIWEHAASVQKRADKADALLRDVVAAHTGENIDGCGMSNADIDRITAHLSENNRG